MPKFEIDCWKQVILRAKMIIEADDKDYAVEEFFENFYHKLDFYEARTLDSDFDIKEVK